MSKGWILPEIGDDWLRGLRNCYIIVAPHMCTAHEPAFWRGDGDGYTYHLVDCGLYTSADLTGQLGRYNDGCSSVAIPLTRTALKALGLKTTIDFTALKRFATVENVTSE